MACSCCEEKRDPFGQPREAEEKPSALQYSVANYMREHVPRKKTKFMYNQVEYFTASRAVDALLDSPWASGADKQPLLFTDRQSVADFLDGMLHFKFFHRAKKVAISDRDLRRKRLKKLKKLGEEEEKKTAKTADHSGSDHDERRRDDERNAEAATEEMSAVEGEEAAEEKSALETGEADEEKSALEGEEEAEDNSVGESGEAAEEKRILGSVETAEEKSAAEGDEAVQEKSALGSGEAAEEKSAAEGDEAVQEKSALGSGEAAGEKSAAEGEEAVKEKSALEGEASPEVPIKEPEEGKPRRRVKLEMHMEQMFVDGNDAYVWLYEPVPAHYWLLGALIVGGIVAICLFPLWPQILRDGVYYLSMAAAGFLAVILGLAVLRSVLFWLLWLLTLGRHQLWILPNLTEDVGFFESFWPLYQYEYHGKKEASEKKTKKRMADRPKTSQRGGLGIKETKEETAAKRETNGSENLDDEQVMALSNAPQEEDRKCDQAEQENNGDDK